MVAHRAELIAFAGKVIAVEPKEQLQEQPEDQTTAQPQEPLEEQPPEPPQGEPATAEADHA